MKTIEVIGIRDRNTHKLEFFDNSKWNFKKGELCVIRSQWGLDIAIVSTKPRLVKEGYIKNNTFELVRRVTEEDLKRYNIILEKEKRAHIICWKRIKKRKLPMKLITVKFNLEMNKAIFYFTADGRIDFRDLVKDLAYEFRCRIEMRQIGVRDGARMLGGVGCCGRPLCCISFLREFEPVTIKMAKDQELTLVPSKTSGICGRLMCCLSYEYSNYLEIRKRIPFVGKKVLTPKGLGKIKYISLIKEKIIAELDNGEYYEFSIPPAPSNKKENQN